MKNMDRFNEGRDRLLVVSVSSALMKHSVDSPKSSTCTNMSLVGASNATNIHKSVAC